MERWFNQLSERREAVMRGAQLMKDSEVIGNVTEETREIYFGERQTGTPLRLALRHLKPDDTKDQPMPTILKDPAAVKLPRVTKEQAPLFLRRSRASTR